MTKEEALYNAVYAVVTAWSFDPMVNLAPLMAAAKNFDKERYYEAFRTGERLRREAERESSSK